MESKFLSLILKSSWKANSYHFIFISVSVGNSGGSISSVFIVNANIAETINFKKKGGKTLKRKVIVLHI
jgi:hypothetical protein